MAPRERCHLTDRASVQPRVFTGRSSVQKAGACVIGLPSGVQARQIVPNTRHVVSFKSQLQIPGPLAPLHNHLVAEAKTGQRTCRTPYSPHRQCQWRAARTHRISRRPRTELGGDIPRRRLSHQLRHVPRLGHCHRNRRRTRWSNRHGNTRCVDVRDLRARQLRSDRDETFRIRQSVHPANKWAADERRNNPRKVEPMLGPVSQNQAIRSSTGDPGIHGGLDVTFRKLILHQTRGRRCLQRRNAPETAPA